MLFSGSPKNPPEYRAPSYHTPDAVDSRIPPKNLSNSGDKVLGLSDGKRVKPRTIEGGQDKQDDRPGTVYVNA